MSIWGIVQFLRYLSSYIFRTHHWMVTVRWLWFDPEHHSSFCQANPCAVAFIKLAIYFSKTNPPFLRLNHQTSIILQIDRNQSQYEYGAIEEETKYKQIQKFRGFVHFSRGTNSTNSTNSINSTTPMESSLVNQTLLLQWPSVNRQVSSFIRL